MLLEPLHGGGHVEGVPQHDDVRHQAEGAELVFLALAVAPPQLAALAVEHGAGQAVPAHAPVQLGQGGAALGLVVDVGQRVQRLLDTAELGHRLGRAGGPVAGLERAHGAGRWHATALERAGQAQQVIPVLGD